MNDKEFDALDVYTGIIAGFPVLVKPDPNSGIWVAPANLLAWIFLTPYMASWFYNADTPVFIYEGSYIGGLLDWALSAKEYL